MLVNFSMIARDVLPFFVHSKVIVVFSVRSEPSLALPFKKRWPAVDQLAVVNFQQLLAPPCASTADIELDQR
jgi:hypothetical protein